MTDVLEAQGLIAGLAWEHPSSAFHPAPTPAVATGFAYTVPGTVDQLVVAVSFQLVTDGNAADRLVTFQFVDYDGTSYAPVAAPFTQAASLTTLYTFAVGIQQFGADDAAAIGCGIPPVKLPSGCGVKVTLGSVQVGDQVSAVALLLNQWPVRPPLR